METAPLYNRLARIGLVHAPIVATYMLVTGVLFVVLPEPRPLLTGALQGVFIGLHLGMTVFLSFRWRLSRAVLMAHLSTLFLLIALLQLANRPYWAFLWSLRLF